ncbi:MAG: hypothetical protein GTN36_05510 [Candidatus Aenigmarchaeota archaeon]|nr:hypothetical protein [Candidatus Aenigmarchaeota archaeon]
MGFLAAAAGAAAVAGALSSKGKRQSTTIDAAPASLQELNATSLQDQQISALGNIFPFLSKQTEVGQSFADRLGQLAETGGLPSAQQLDIARGFAAEVFGPRRAALQESFRSQEQASNQLAASLGRSINDPILQAKLRTSLAGQEAQLDAEQTAFGAQFAQNLPMQQVQFGAQQLDVLNAISQQALNNRLALLQAGTSVVDQHMKFRLGTASQTTQGPRPGFMGALGAGLGAAGTVMSFGAGGGIGSLFGGAAGGGATNQALGGISNKPMMTP